MGAWRVNGNLSVSRAIGDAKEKVFVVGQADVATFDLEGNEDYLVVACDGIWDVVDGPELVECVSSHLQSASGSKPTVARALIQFAVSEGSGDNMTAIVVYFKGFKAAQAEEAPPPTTTGTDSTTTTTSSSQSCENEDKLPPPSGESPNKSVT